jgi:hypothetical protein
MSRQISENDSIMRVNMFVFMLRCLGLGPVMLSGLIISVVFHNTFEANLYLNTALATMMVMFLIYVAVIVIHLASPCAYRISIAMFMFVDIAIWIIATLLVLSLTYDSDLEQSGTIGTIFSLMLNIISAIMILISITIDITLQMVRDDTVEHV